MRPWFVAHQANKHLSAVSLAFKHFLVGEAAKLMARKS